MCALMTDTPSPLEYEILKDIVHEVDDPKSFFLSHIDDRCALICAYCVLGLSIVSKNMLRDIPAAVLERADTFLWVKNHEETLTVGEFARLQIDLIPERLAGQPQLGQHGVFLHRLRS